MTDGHRSRNRTRAFVLLGAAVGAVFLLALSVTTGSGLTASRGSSLPASAVGGPLPSGSSAATSIREVAPEPTEAVAGVPVNVSWEAFTVTGTRAVTFAVDCYLSVTAAGGSTPLAWVNASAVGPLSPASNGSFVVPSPAWNAGVLRLSVDLARATPVSVQLLGPYLPSLPGPVALTVLPDAEHLALSHPDWTNGSRDGSWSSSALWQVQDRFGNPAPGAVLDVEFATGSATQQSFVPAVWSLGGTTVAWVNCSAANGTTGTVTVRDEAGDLLFGPVGAPTAVAQSSAGASPILSPFALLVVSLLVVGAFAGIGLLVSGGRARRSPAGAEGEEDLRRLAEGRAAVVELVREGGPLELREIEARWEPPPAPPAVADWVASLVTDGTLTATLGEGGRARFALARPPGSEPRVTLDEEALEAGIARREAAVDETEDGAGR